MFSPARLASVLIIATAFASNGVQAQSVRAEMTTVTIVPADPGSVPADSGEITINVPRNATRGLDRLATVSRQLQNSQTPPPGNASRGMDAMSGALKSLERETSRSISIENAGTAPAGEPVPAGRTSISIGKHEMQNRGIIKVPQIMDQLPPPPGPFMQKASDEPLFLQPPTVETSTPAVARGGVTLPLRPEMLQEKPMPLTIPTVNVTTLTNGIVLYHYQSKDLPRVQVSLMLDAGSRLDSAEKLGLAELTARTVRSGGAAGTSGDDIDRQLEQIGSDFSFSANRENTAGTMFALTENIDKAMKILADILLHPEFDDKKLQKQRELMLENIRRENDEPADISRREFRKIIYGAEHWLARTPKAPHVNAITRDDVLKFYEEWYRPASLRVGVSGDISKEDAQKLVETALAGWTKPAANVPPRGPVADETNTTGVFYIRKMTAQSQIRMGHLGMARLSPDIYPVTILNGVYGTGGFSSRLMNRVRTKRGFVYGVGGGVMNDDPRGLFIASAASKSRTTAAAVEEIMDVTRELLTGNISEEEIETSKRDNIFSFLTDFARPEQIVNKYMTNDFQGYPPDYLQTYIDRLRAVTKEQVVAMAKKYIHPDNIRLMVIGFEKQFDKPVASFGPVTEVKLDTAE